jgi:UDP-N-acetylmuramate dehydrogenase
VGAGALLSQLISKTVKAGLQGLEVLVGIPGSVGGALRGNAGGSGGDIGQFVSTVSGLTAAGAEVTRSDDELAFGYRDSNLRDLLIVEAVFDLQPGDVEEMTRRLRKLWIMKKATQPLTVQSAGCIFKNPRGMSAGLLIDQAGLKGTRIGNAEISDRHANFIIAHEDASSEDVLRLIDLAKSKVNKQFGVDPELEIEIW